MIVDTFAAREISFKSCEWRVFFFTQKEQHTIDDRGRLKNNKFCMKYFSPMVITLRFWPKINNRLLRGIKKQLVLHEIFSNNGDQSRFFWQRKKYQTIDDCGWLKTCSPCMEYFRLIVIKWCFFCEKEYAVAAHKIFPKKFDRRVLSKKTWWSMIGELLVHLLANSKFKFLRFSTKKVFAFSVTNRLVGIGLLVVWLVGCLVGILAGWFW